MSSLQSAKVLRHSLRRAASCSRYNSTQANSSAGASPIASSSQGKLNVQSKAKLPDEKLRVLVSLYHQAGTFITKENLSQAIDQAFTDPVRLLQTSALHPETPFHYLEAELGSRRALPKFGKANSALARSNAPHVHSGESWSDRRPIRERAVMTTLYGVLGRGRPGLDAVRDEEERVKRELAQDKASSS
ncbi:hypothetical protein BC628DRAFT_1417198 [Trametes gibbosa]|nr:hypothetical protein BC628DRAFT_1417198 [Trametes gibbosa]